MAEKYQEIRDAVRSLCASFPPSYHRQIDEDRAYPEAFVDALTEAGWLAALIPEEYGGSGLGLTEASVIMEEINRAGGNSGACHGQMYNMGTLLRHGSDAQKALYLPQIASGALRLQSMGVTINRPPRDGRMAFVRSPDGISVELLQMGEAQAAAEPWASMDNTGEW